MVLYDTKLSFIKSRDQLLRIYIGEKHWRKIAKRLLTVLVTGTVLSLGALAPSVNAARLRFTIESSCHQSLTLI